MGSGKSKLSKTGTSQNKTASMKRSEEIKNEVIEKAMQSKIKGIARDAKAGTGNYTFKNSSAIDKKDIDNIKEPRELKKGDNVIIYGEINNKNVFFAGKSNDAEIIAYQKKKQEKARKHAEEERKNAENRPEIRTTSTYDRWKKQHDRNFAAWFGNR